MYQLIVNMDGQQFKFPFDTLTQAERASKKFTRLKGVKCEIKSSKKDDDKITQIIKYELAHKIM